MKKIVTFLLVAMAFINLSYAKKVDENTAKIVGRQFMINKAVNGAVKDFSDVRLSYTSDAPNDSKSPTAEVQVYYYVFNFNSTPGFVIVSGDDIVEPILGYSNQKSFDATHIPAHVAAWLKGYEDQIQYAINQQMQATPEIKTKWELYKTTTAPKPFFRGVQAVAPLIQTTWNQSPYYNDLCPYDNQANDRAVTGCVATAMAMVLKYWNSPATGAGFHSYNDPKYGTQSADFGGTTYDWTNMPMVLNGPNTPIATLMHDCGVSVDMAYGVASGGGSNAYVISSQSPVTNCAEYALKTYFGYPTTMQGQVRQNFDDNAWKAMMKTDLDASRPLIYAGFGSGGGHCFLCDGYDGNGMFHFNWGWQGQFDGYFDINALNPEGVGIGGGTGGFNSGQQAIFGVQGNGGGGGGGGGNQTFGLSLYSPLTISPTQIGYGNPFNVSTDIANFGPGVFHGTFCAAIFDTSYSFIDFVDSTINVQLDSGYYNTVNFAYPGKFTLLPGTYYLATYYKSPGGNWISVGNYLTNTNLLQVQVVNPNSIEMYSSMNVTPGTTLSTGAQVAVHLNVINNGSANFNGIFDVSLYNLNGSFAAAIQQLSGKNLPAGHSFTNGLDFTNPSLNVAPGSYLLALQYSEDNGTTWSLTGSTYFGNPITVLVQQAILGADLYEPNNTIAQSFQLPVNFTGNTATVNTLGANCNTGTDYDYYKIMLPAGNSYTIGALVNDAGYGDGGQSYSLDAIWTYSTDGTTWSPTFDNVDPNNIVMLNGRTVYFEVSPKFTGKTGTYNLVLTIRKNALGIDESTQNAFTVYPNPAIDYIYIAPANQQQRPSKVSIITIDGREIKSIEPGKQEDIIKIGTADLQNGFYILRIFSSEGFISKQVVIRK